MFNVEVDFTETMKCGRRSHGKLVQKQMGKLLMGKLLKMLDGKKAMGPDVVYTGHYRIVENNWWSQFEMWLAAH